MDDQERLTIDKPSLSVGEDGIRAAAGGLKSVGSTAIVAQVCVVAMIVLVVLVWLFKS